MNIRLFRIILPVRDIERAAAFYAAVLGKPGQRVSAGRHYFDCGGTIVACVDPLTEDQGHAAVPLSEWVYFAVPDLEALHDAVVKAGGRLSSGMVHDQPAGDIIVRPWGERSFYAFDPFDNKICFVDENTLFTGG